MSRVRCCRDLVNTLQCGGTRGKERRRTDVKTDASGPLAPRAPTGAPLRPARSDHPSRALYRKAPACGTPQSTRTRHARRHGGAGVGPAGRPLPCRAARRDRRPRAAAATRAAPSVALRGQGRCHEPELLAAGRPAPAASRVAAGRAGPGGDPPAPGRVADPAARRGRRAARPGTPRRPLVPLRRGGLRRAGTAPRRAGGAARRRGAHRRPPRAGPRRRRTGSCWAASPSTSCAPTRTAWTAMWPSTTATRAARRSGWPSAPWRTAARGGCAGTRRPASSSPNSSSTPGCAAAIRSSSATASTTARPALHRVRPRVPLHGRPVRPPGPLRRTRPAPALPPLQPALRRGPPQRPADPPPERPPPVGPPRRTTGADGDRGDRVGLGVTGRGGAGPAPGEPAVVVVRTALRYFPAESPEKGSAS